MNIAISRPRAAFLRRSSVFMRLVALLALPCTSAFAPPASRRAVLAAGAAACGVVLPCSAVVEGVCLDGQLKWKLFREGKGPEAGRWCEEFSYADTPAFKQLQAEQLQRQAATAADADSGAADTRALLAAFNSRKGRDSGAATPAPEVAGAPEE